MNFADAIASIESGGRYDSVGPVTRTGDKAYGKYQVMGANVGPWTETFLGRRYTPEEFLRDPKAQDAVFGAKFDEYRRKYGPAGASAAWFAGERGMNDPNRKDILGTSVSDYTNKFVAATGQPFTMPKTQAPAAPPPGIAAAFSPDIGGLPLTFPQRSQQITPPEGVAFDPILASEIFQPRWSSKERRTQNPTKRAA